MRRKFCNNCKKFVIFRISVYFRYASRKKTHYMVKFRLFLTCFLRVLVVVSFLEILHTRAKSRVFFIFLLTMNITFCSWNIDDAVRILSEVASELVRDGKPLWDPKMMTHEYLLSQYKKEDFIVWYLDDTPICSVVLQWSDPIFWPETPADSSWFIHKFAICVHYRGQWISTTLFEYLKSECRRRNIHSLKLDVDPLREGLCRHYEKHGFSLVDRVDRGGFAVQRYVLYF